MNNKIYDVAIVGAGPTGLFAGFQAGVNDITAILLDSLKVVGGQCTVLYPEKFIYDLPGHEKITAQELVNNLKKQCDRFNHDYLLGNQVVNLKKGEDIFILKTNKENVIEARTVIIAAGGGSFNPNKPTVENLQKFESSSVLYFIDDMSKFHNKTLAIAGGGDSAVDWALMLTKHQFPPKKIYFIHRRDEMRCHPNSLTELRSLEGEKLEFKIPFTVSKLLGDELLTSAILQNFDNQEQFEEITIDYFLPFFGLRGEIDVIKNFGIDFIKNKIPVNYSTMLTNLNGVYAIGDICEYAGKTKLLVTGFHEAVVACNSINHYLSNKFLRQKKGFEYSTSKFQSM